MTYGSLYLIPTPLGDTPAAKVLPAEVLSLISRLDRYVVENERSARRFLSSAGLKGRIDSLTLRELSEHSTPRDVEALLPLFEQGHDVGLVSEAGLPAVADPGAALVALCHEKGIAVYPQVGPSSLMLALMGSGLNGQSFAFRGYLPAKTAERRRAIREVESESARLSRSEIFIETPYRNDSLLGDLLAILRSDTLLCLAADLTLPSQTLRTKSVAEWKKEGEQIGKRPCVFILLAK